MVDYAAISCTANVDRHSDCWNPCFVSWLLVILRNFCRPVAAVSILGDRCRKCPFWRAMLQAETDNPQRNGVDTACWAQSASYRWRVPFRTSKRFTQLILGLVSENSPRTPRIAYSSLRALDRIRVHHQQCRLAVCCNLKIALLFSNRQFPGFASDRMPVLYN